MNGSVAVASSSQIAAEAGGVVAGRGGNAVDTAIAAALTSMTTEPGVCGLGAAGFVTIWCPGDGAVTIDGYAAVPGVGLAEERLGRGGVEVFLEYGGGVHTVIGPGSVAVPGSIAALGEASERFGALDWKAQLEPVIDIAREGFPLPQACQSYLVHAADKVFGLDRAGWECLHDGHGRLKQAGATVRVPHLAETLEQLAECGADEFYTGELGRRIADHVQQAGGALNRGDLELYRAITREALETTVGAWQVATNPPPAIGGVVLIAMLKLMAGDYPSLPAQPVPRLIAIQELILGFRRRTLNRSVELEHDLAVLLGAVERDDLELLGSPTTVQTSAVDEDGLACSITMSTGYGSGLMPTGSGIWLNNCLGELELNPAGLRGRAPGQRLPSNMAPTVARNARGSALAIGSPGADRITTALLRVLTQHLLEGTSLADAIAASRVHLEFAEDGPRLAHEPLEDLPRQSPPLRPFAELSMYFGGVSAASFDAVEGLKAVADPRRAGGIRIMGAAS